MAWILACDLNNPHSKIWGTISQFKISNSKTNIFFPEWINLIATDKGPLRGEVRISGKKNAALPLMIASLLTEQTLGISNIPHLHDITTTMEELLGQLGVKLQVDEKLSIEAVESGNAEKIAVWMLDTDYDGRSLYPNQVFSPMSGPKDGWSKLARNLKAEIDEDLIEAYRGTLSLPFELGKNQRIAVKIVYDRGFESLRVVEAIK